MTDIITDEELVKKIQEGEENLFTLVIDRYESKMKRYARKFLQVEDDIDDLVQEVFIKVYANIRSFDPDRKFSSWLYRIARNTFLNHIRSSKKNMLRIDFDAALPFLYSYETPETSFVEKNLAKGLDACMKDIDEKYREVLVLRFYEGLSYEEIADVLRIPLSTVGVRISRAIKHIQKKYAEKYE